MTHRDFAKAFRIEKGKGFRLKDIAPGETLGLKSKQDAQKTLAGGVALLSELQEKLYAQDRWALLVIFQAMDAAGKDSAVKHVMSGVNPQGCQVYSFKAPSPEEPDHDFLWRTMRCLPERGRNTTTKHAPWYVVPADHKWFTRLAVAAALIDALEELDLAFPKVDTEKRKELQAARVALTSESGGAG